MIKIISVLSYIAEKKIMLIEDYNKKITKDTM